MLQSIKKQKQKKGQFHGEAGISLLEMIIVLGIIGTILGVILTNIGSGQEDAQISLAQSKAATLHTAAIKYRTSKKRFPKTMDELNTTTEDPEEYNDPWGMPYELIFSKGKLCFKSYGPDSAPDTEDDLYFFKGKRYNANCEGKYSEADDGIDTDPSEGVE